jgi:hypothetical protein
MYLLTYALFLTPLFLSFAFFLLGFLLPLLLLKLQLDLLLGVVLVLVRVRFVVSEGQVDFLIV